MTYPLPSNMEFIRWTAQLKNNINNINFPNPIDEKDWWKWVANLIQLNPNINIPVASKISYPEIRDWRKWGNFFIGNLGSQ